MRTAIKKLVLTILALLLATVPVFAAKGKAAGAAKGPKAKVQAAATTRAPKAKTQAPKAKTHVKTSPAGGSTVKAAKVTAPRSAKATTTKVSKKTPTTAMNTPTATTVTKTPTATTATKTPTATIGIDPAPWTPTNAVAQKAFTKPSLMTKVEIALPGTDLNAATAGFKNFGQFNAAVNASTNHGIPFADLKAAMTGITIDGVPTGQPVLSLGQAMQTLRTGVATTTEVPRTQTMANR